MYKRLIKDASLYSISSLLARGFSLITVPIFTRILSPADYGALDLLSYFSVLAPLVIGLALDQAVARFYIDSDSEQKKKAIASTVLFYNIFIFVIFIPFYSPLAEFLSVQWLAGHVDKETVSLVFLFIWIRTIFYIANNQLKYLFLSKQFAFCNIGNTILSTLLCIIFIIYNKWGVFGIFLGQAIGQGVFALVSICFARKSYALVFDWQTLKKMLQYSLPLVPGTLSFFVMQYVDRYVLNELKGLTDVGVYGIGARLGSLVNLFLTGFQGAWHPIVMKTFREPDAPERFRVVFNYYIFITSAIVLLLSLFGKEILELLTTSEFSKAFIIVPMMVLSAILASIAAYFTYGIQIAKKSSIRLFINASGLLLNIVLNYLLIYRLGIMGAALATTITFVYMAVIGMTISQKLYYVPYNIQNLLLVCFIVTMCSNAILVLPHEISLTMLLFKALLLILSLFIVAKMLDIKNIKSFISSNLSFIKT